MIRFNKQHSISYIIIGTAVLIIMLLCATSVMGITLPAIIHIVIAVLGALCVGYGAYPLVAPDDK